MNHFRVIALFVLAAFLSASQSGCATAKGGSPVEKRADAQQMRSDTLATFYAKYPQMRGELAKAPGYGVFSAVSTHTIIVSSGNGFGIIHDNATKKDTYMRALKLGGGLGVGIQDVRGVVVFHDAKVMQQVLDHGWGVTGKAEAAAKAGDSGGAGSVVITLPGMSIYRFTEKGAMVGGAIEGAKIWKDEELN